jgi:hypothetical protein
MRATAGELRSRVSEARIMQIRGWFRFYRW